MSSYNHFAFVYDDLTENVEYEKRFHYMMSFFKEYNIQNSAHILDLACGTGSFSLLFANAGYRVTGMDASAQMLTVADSKCGSRANFLKGDMCSFRLSEKYDGCICCMDSINHLSDLEQVEHAFRCVGTSLKKDGLFIFDVNTIYKHNNILSDHAFVFDEENYFLAWDNEGISDGEVRIFLDLFVKQDADYKRFSESFTEKAYSVKALKTALEPYFSSIEVFDDLSRKSPQKTSERLYFVCRSK